MGLRTSNLVQLYRHTAYVQIMSRHLWLEIRSIKIVRSKELNYTKQNNQSTLLKFLSIIYPYDLLKCVFNMRAQGNANRIAENLRRNFFHIFLPAEN